MSGPLNGSLKRPTSVPLSQARRLERLETLVEHQAQLLDRQSRVIEQLDSALGFLMHVVQVKAQQGSRFEPTPRVITMSAKEAYAAFQKQRRIEAHRAQDHANGEDDIPVPDPDALYKGS